MIPGLGTLVPQGGVQGRELSRAAIHNTSGSFSDAMGHSQASGWWGQGKLEQGPLQREERSQPFLWSQIKTKGQFLATDSLWAQWRNPRTHNSPKACAYKAKWGSHLVMSTTINFFISSGALLAPPETCLPIKPPLCVFSTSEYVCI